MSKLLRRIVTSIDKDGKAFFESDDTPPVTFTMEGEWPGFNNVELWKTKSGAPSIHDEHHKDETYDFNITPGTVRFCTMRLPPLKKLLAHQSSLGREVDIKNFGMHRTDTIDYLVLLEGEATLILDNGEEKTLKPGDTVVQKGNVHAWHNRGEIDCVMVCVMIGALST
ncbi:MAG: Cupin domain protein [Burkholderiales bacterium]|jgi:mannose-6-phosphate isomerase-like protein (cupin superfamily)|nr:Cupin domain protein [Burkholderiales bacterium]